ncbi:MAG: hypothetical protein WDM85_02210 [Caulobacteraceae bacterium]
MQRILMLAAALALFSVSPALAAKGGPPYKLDVKGKCHDSSGALAVQTLCGKSTPAPTTPAKPTVAATSPRPTTTARAAPKCKAGNKPCGKICISAAKTCHV